MLTRFLVLAAIIATLATHVAAQSTPEQLKILRKAAEGGSAPAQYALGASAEASGDLAGALGWYRRAANNGYAGAQYHLALMLEAGLGTAPDPVEARRLLERSASAGFQPSLDRLARREATRAAAEQATAAPAKPAASAPAASPVVPPAAPVTAVSTPSMLDTARELVFSGWGIVGVLVLVGAGVAVRLRTLQDRDSSAVGRSGRRRRRSRRS